MPFPSSLSSLENEFIHFKVRLLKISSENLKVKGEEKGNLRISGWGKRRKRFFFLLGLEVFGSGRSKGVLFCWWNPLFYFNLRNCIWFFGKMIFFIYCSLHHSLRKNYLGKFKEGKQTHKPIFCNLLRDEKKLKRFVS